MDTLLEQEKTLTAEVEVAERNLNQVKQQLADVKIKIFEQRTGIVPGNRYMLNGNKIEITVIGVRYGDAVVHYRVFKKDGKLGKAERRAWLSDLNNLKAQLAIK